MKVSSAAQDELTRAYCVLTARLSAETTLIMYVVWITGGNAASVTATATASLVYTQNILCSS